MFVARVSAPKLLGVLGVVLAGILLWQFPPHWPNTLDDFRQCQSDAECGFMPGCHPNPIALARRDAWTAYRTDCHCGPCRFAASARTPGEAWKGWIDQVIEHRQLCPEDPATASIVCEKPGEAMCSESHVCISFTPENDARPTRKRR